MEIIVVFIVALLGGIFGALLVIASKVEELVELLQERLPNN